MDGWLIYKQTDANDNQPFIRWFQNEASREQMTLRLVLREQLTIGICASDPALQVDGKQVTLPDFAVVRTIEPLLNEHLENLGIRVYNNAETARICNHKGLTHSYISRLAVPANDTMVASRNSDLTEAPPFPYPFVMKEAGGRSGRNVHLIDNKEAWEQLKSVSFADDLIIQAAHNIQFGKDVRVFVVGTTIIGAVLRENSHDFRANYKLGGAASWYPLNTGEIKLVKQITTSFNFGMVGIDFLLDQNGGLIFNEIEDVVGSRTLSMVSNSNILKYYVRLIKKSGKA